MFFFSLNISNCLVYAVAKIAAGVSWLESLSIYCMIHYYPRWKWVLHFFLNFLSLYFFQPAKWNGKWRKQKCFELKRWIFVKVSIWSSRILFIFCIQHYVTQSCALHVWKIVQVHACFVAVGENVHVHITPVLLQGMYLQGLLLVSVYDSP